MMALGLIVPLVFTVIFMRALRGWLTSKDEIAPGEPVKPKA
jgi:hypothetical protein